MEIILNRISDNKESTLGAMYIDNKLVCFTLEDTYREVKKMNETCIPTGRFRIKFNPNDTPMTLKYRKRYQGFFTNHLELQNVPFFSNVYIHVGNTADDSSGCILVGKGANTNADRDGFISQSVDAFKKIYPLISQALNDKEDVFINIKETFPRV